MKLHTIRVAPAIALTAMIAAGAFLLPTIRSIGEETPAAPPSTPAATATPAPATPAPKRMAVKISYKAPPGSLGVATSREGGGTRGAGDALPALYVLAPEHVAMTTKAQPVLFWFQGQPAKAALEVTLTEPKKPKPLLSVKLEKADKAGIRALSLAQHNVTLEPGIEYRWSVSLVPDASNRSKDKFASGVIKRIPTPSGLDEKTEAASKAEAAALYAQSGLWYDALQSISEAITQDPSDASLHQMRAALLTQGKLAEVAKAETK